MATYAVGRLDLVVVCGVLEGKRQHTLLLQVGLVDTGKASSDDGQATEMTGLKSSVLSGGTLAVVPVTDNDPLDALLLVVTSDSRNGVPLSVGVVLDLVGLTVGLVDGTDKHVVGDVVKVTTVLQPGAGHGDVVSGGLALSLDQDRDIEGVLAIPGLEGLENLETVGGGGDGDVHAGAVLGRGLVGVVTGVVATSGETITRGGLEEELVAILILELVGQGVEVQGTGDGESDDEVRGGDEGVSGRVAVVSPGEVTVVRRDDRVGLALLDVLTIPLTNARTASVGENHTTELLEGLELTIALNGSANLLRARGDSEGSLGLQAVVESIASDRGGARHVLVRRVGARTDETNLEVLGPVVVLDGLAELGDGGGQIGGEGTVDVRLELGQVDLDELVVLGTLVLTEVSSVRASKVTNVLPASGSQVLVHALVEGEQGGRGTDLSTCFRLEMLMSLRSQGGTYPCCK